MLYLPRYLGVIIGEKIPNRDEHLLMYVLLRKIVDILMSPRIVDQYITDLEELVYQLCTEYLSYQALKPKFHFLTHNAFVLLDFGRLYIFGRWDMNSASLVGSKFYCHCRQTKFVKNDRD